jgi:hypothetical protein
VKDGADLHGWFSQIDSEFKSFLGANVRNSSAVGFTAPVPFPPTSTPVSARAAAIAVLRDSSRRMTPLHRSLHVSASVATVTSLQRVAPSHRCIVAWLYKSVYKSPPTGQAS